MLWAPLSVVCYWVVVVVLALLLTWERGVGSGFDKGMGTGAGDGVVLTGGLGQSANKDSSGAGAAQQESHGTDMGRQTQGENGTGDGEANSADTADGMPDEAGKTSPDLADDSLDDGEEASASEDIVLFENQISVKNNTLTSAVADVKKKPLKEKKLDAQSTKDKSNAHGSTKLKGSQAGKMEGFFGSGSVSGNVMFIVDVSGSMMVHSPEGVILLELLKRELKKVLEQKLHELKEGKKAKETFSIITYSNQIDFFPNDKGALSFNSAKDIKDALKFVEQLDADGGTDMALAWQTARPLIKKHKVKCVYFLTDGEDMRFHADDIKDVNVRINTFSLGNHSPTLEEIAKNHKGKYTEIY